jgi:CubicO group peptidase (beta-lactamase class C family)
MALRGVRFPVVLLLLVGLARSVCPAARAPVPEQFRDIRKSIEDRLAKEQVPSVAVVVAKDGKVLWEDAIGWADVEKRVPATPDTSYLLCSVSKPITATALMVLVERGKLSLDEPANKYLGEAKLQAYVGDAAQATLRRLADHTSGLARHDLYFYPDERREPITVEERIRRYGRLLREPGETYEYSNLGYMVLAHVIERQSGKSFDRFLRDEVFLPLGMEHSSLGVDPERRQGAAVCYGADQKPVQESTAQSTGGAGGVYASARDLLRFGLFHLKESTGDQRRILSDQTLDLMHRPSSRTGPLSWYGIGWRTEQGAFGSPALMHTGQSGGATACLVLIPKHRLCVVALANAAHDLPWRVTQEVVNLLVPRAKEPPKLAVGHERFGRREYKPAKEWLGHWEGVIKTYERDIPVEMWFEDSGVVQVQMKAQSKTAAAGVRIDDGYLRGTIDGDIGTSDTMGRRYRLHFKLNRRGETLNGSITAGHTPGQRVITLSHWIELRRTQ